MNARIHDPRPCLLGEGPLWHPTRKQLFWFDILGQKLLTLREEWTFGRPVSAAGWVDENRLAVASATNLIVFDLRDGTSEPLVDLEADNPVTRCNDGRADPQGGFWISTMGRLAEPGAGAFYRWYKGELRKLFPDITIPNATCFAPDGRTAYFADTAKSLVWRQALDAKGWPMGERQVYLDHTGTDVNPDGAVVDAAGNFWCAEWGLGRVAAYDQGGKLIEELKVPAAQSSCPAFGGPDLQTLFVTTARKGNPQATEDTTQGAGQTFAIDTGYTGQAEHQVIL